MLHFVTQSLKRDSAAILLYGTVLIVLLEYSSFLSCPWSIYSLWYTLSVKSPQSCVVLTGGDKSLKQLAASHLRARQQNSAVVIVNILHWHSATSCRAIIALITSFVVFRSRSISETSYRGMCVDECLYELCKAQNEEVPIYIILVKTFIPITNLINKHWTVQKRKPKIIWIPQTRITRYFVSSLHAQIRQKRSKEKETIYVAPAAHRESPACKLALLAFKQNVECEI